VRDATHSDTAAQAHDVEEVLRALDIDPHDRTRLVEVWNKIDRLDRDGRERVVNLAEREPADRRPVLVSALTGEGIGELSVAIEARLSETRQRVDVSLAPGDGAGLNWLYRHAEVLAKDMADDGSMTVTVRADPDKAARVRAKFGTSRRP
jgi:GTP-binding protein HflX